MNDTKKLPPRLEKILKLLDKNPQGLSRLELQAHFKNISKITLVRDLNQLLIKNLIKSTGVGRGIKYLSQALHPLLKYVNPTQYFKAKPDQRQAVKSFDFKVFNSLANLLTNSETSKLTTLNNQYLDRLKPLNPTIFKREIERFTIELSWKSSKIEGNTYSVLETETLIKQHQLAQGKSKQEAQMILNHKTTFDTILKHKTSFKTLTLTDILNIHTHLVDKLDILKNIRSQPVGITGTSYLPLKIKSQIKLALEKTIKAVNQAKHPIEKALIAVAMISYIQPFGDGNKRTSRLVGNALLLAHQHMPLSYRSVDELEYKQAMVLFYETLNLYPFKKIFLSQYKFALKNYFT